MSRRDSALLVVLAAAWLAATPALAQTETRRAPANNPATVKAGSLFTMHQHLVSSEPDFEAQEAEALGGKDKRAQQLAQIQRLDADALPARYVRSLEGLMSMSIMVDVMRGIYTNPAEFQRRIDAARNIVHRPDGTTVTLPSLVAATYHRADLRLAARTLQERKPGGSVAGAYTAAVKGAECPFPAGTITLTQRGSLIEGTRDGRLLLWGALGEKGAAFLATEQRYVKVTRGPQGMTVEAPDSPTEFYVATLGAPALVLTGTQRKTCTITLTRGSSGTK